MTYKTKEERAAYAREWRAKHRDQVRAEDRVRSKAVTNDPEKREARRIYMKEYRASHPQYQDRAKQLNKEWAFKNKEHLRDKQRKHRAENIEHYREYNARWHRENRANNPEKVRAMHLKSLYGLTPEDYNRMLVEQGGHCAACERTPDNEKHGVLHVDHDHTTGAVRGLLCHRCNTAYGLIAENLDGLAAYAKR